MRPFIKSKTLSYDRVPGAAARVPCSVLSFTTLIILAYLCRVFGVRPMVHATLQVNICGMVNSQGDDIIRNINDFVSMKINNDTCYS